MPIDQAVLTAIPQGFGTDFRFTVSFYDTTNTLLGAIDIPIPKSSTNSGADVRSQWIAATSTWCTTNGLGVPSTFWVASDGESIPNATISVAGLMSAADKTKLNGISASTRTTSTLSLSLVGTGATGTQISSTKDSTVRVNVSTSTTATIGGASTSLVVLKKCSTNNATEASWTTVATLENDQTVSLAVILNSLQVLKGQLESDIPAGWYVKLVNSGTGTHTESFVTGEQTIYG